MPVNTMANTILRHCAAMSLAATLILGAAQGASALQLKLACTYDNDPAPFYFDINSDFYNKKNYGDHYYGHAVQSQQSGKRSSDYSETATFVRWTIATTNGNYAPVVVDRRTGRMSAEIRDGKSGAVIEIKHGTCKKIDRFPQTVM